MVPQVSKIRTFLLTSELEAFLLEANLIKKYLPKYNIRLTDDKSYQMIKITVRDEFPKIVLARREDDGKSLYFGPFPSSTSIKSVLRTIRKIFPYISVNNHAKRICLYHHLGLCPCPVTQDTEDKRKQYKRDIKRITKFLQGDIEKVVKDLESEREKFSNQEKFEEAMKVQRQIDAVRLITSPFYKPFEFEVNPDLKTELRDKEVKELSKYLGEKGVGVSYLHRIECFDISNISGTNAVGSMVTFIDGEKESKFYRKFKIKNPPKIIPNDFAMMAEVIRRRIGHIEDWGKPDLIIVDGGKGQVSSASKVLTEAGIDIPLVGLAKKEELVITTDFKVIRLPRNSEGLNLIRRIRDEAHRFAITYHKKLRSKSTFY